MTKGFENFISAFDIDVGSCINSLVQSDWERGRIIKKVFQNDQVFSLSATIKMIFDRFP